MKAIFTYLIFILVSASLMANKNEIKLKNAQESDLKMVSKSTTGFQVVSTLSKLDYFVVKTEKGSFVQLKINGYTRNNDFGSPLLPIQKRMIEIPQNANVKVNILSYDEEIINLNDLGLSMKLMPSQPSVSKSADPSEIEFVYNESVYKLNDFNKRPMAEVIELGTMRGVKLGRLEIAPFRYNPVTNELKVYNNIQIEVVFENANLSKTNEIKNNAYSPAFENNFSKLLNYSPVRSKDAITQYPIKMVIVSDPMFETILQPFIEWKTRKGFTVVEAYTNDASVGTTTTSIKNYIQGLYDAGTPTDPAPTYVLFVGDLAQIPAFNAGAHYTDLYYFTYDGTSDIYPEIYYGRFSASNTNQLQPQLDKTLEYEQYLFPDDAFLNDVILVSGVDASWAPVNGNGQINYGTDNYFNAAHGVTDYTWLYPASDAAGVDVTIRNQFSQGASLVNYTAHCSEDGWADPSFTVANVASLTNAHEYPLSIGNCCLSNKFDVAVCFGEALLRAENKGAIGHIGGSNSTYWDEDYWWGVGSEAVSATPAYVAGKLGAYDCLFHDHGEAEIDWFVTNGQIMNAGNLAVTEAGGDEQYYWEIYHLMGDPSVMTYISVPPALTVSYAEPLPVGIGTLDVTTEPYSYVAISQNNVLLDAKYTGSGTTVTLEFTPFTVPGTADIVITKQFRQPYIATIDIFAANTDNDAMMASISVPATYESVTAPDVTPTVTIKNLGNLNLTSAQVGYEIDGGSVVSQAWSGNLAQYEDDVVTFPLITLASGTHTITAFVSWPNGVEDEFHPGDTLEKVFHVTAGDAATVGVYEFLDVYCAAETITPTVTISNKGDVDLLSCDVNYQIDAGAVQTINWTGTLAPNAETTVSFPAITLSPGDHTFNAFTSNPNGGTDENASNDNMAVNFSVFAAAQTVSVDILTDDYGSETSWEITDDDSGDVLYSGGPYADWDSQHFITEYCFGEGCYTFTIMDSYGDGQDGWSNDGSYAVVNVTTSTALGSGSGNWGSDDVVNFCITGVGINEVAQSKVAVYPNPTNGELFVKKGAGNAHVEITNVIGELIYSQEVSDELIRIDLKGNSKGVYFVSVDLNGQIITEKIVLVR
ncbi:MAG: hypothetical protein A2W91_15700 [Bacteroidetes bacterium GWF2_38_335]|nr:MAG: hypothetical protein A2W91_15700 [Bacteroidetes bacterium GWF2_38_335]OFY81467.1 MAG: hypothetical protein A2281_13375 [Bacteroidetes bacterium RIFOXYA12_FULL_38_20]